MLAETAPPPPFPPPAAAENGEESGVVEALRCSRQTPFHRGKPGGDAFLAESLQLDDPGRAQRYGPQEPRRQQRALLSKMLHHGKRLPPRLRPRRTLKKPIGPRGKVLPFPLGIVRKLLVPNEPVWPEIRDANFQLVSVGLQGVGDVDTKGRLPERAQVATVECYLGDHLDVAQIEEPLSVLRLPSALERGSIRGRAREVLTPQSWCSVHEISLSRRISSGASQPGGKRTPQGPESSCDSGSSATSTERRAPSE